LHEIADDDSMILQWFYFAQILYKMVLGLNKVSMLCLYLRIFIGRIFQWLCYATLVVVVGWSVGSVMATIFQCVPISAVWDKSIKGPHCIDSDAFWYAYGIINILTDAAIFALPVREVTKLQLLRREKVGILMVFLLGALSVFPNVSTKSKSTLTKASSVCVTSIVRVNAVANSTKNKMDTTCKVFTQAFPSWLFYLRDPLG